MAGVAVVRFGVFPVGDDQLGNRDSSVGRFVEVGRRRQRPSIGQPLGDDRVVRVAAFRRVVGAEVVAFAVDFDERLIASFEVPVEGVLRVRRGMCVLLKSQTDTVSVWVCLGLAACRPPARAKEKARQVLEEVGATRHQLKLFRAGVGAMSHEIAVVAQGLMTQKSLA